MTRNLFAAAAFAALIAPAVAGSVTVDAMTPTLSGDAILKRTVVKFDDLNPADAKDAATLYERLSHTVAALCTSNLAGKTALVADKVEKCQTRTLKQAVSDVGSEPLKTVAAAAAK